MFIQEKERKARRKGKPMQSEETSSSSYPAEEEEMEGSGASGNEEEAPEDGEGKVEEMHLISIMRISIFSQMPNWEKSKGPFMLFTSQTTEKQLSAIHLKKKKKIQTGYSSFGCSRTRRKAVSFVPLPLLVPLVWLLSSTHLAANKRYLTVLMQCRGLGSGGNGIRSNTNIAVVSCPGRRSQQQL